MLRRMRLIAYGVVHILVGWIALGSVVRAGQLQEASQKS